MRFLIALLILGAVGYFVYRRFFTPEKRSCARLSQLCGFKPHDHERCVSQLTDLGRSASGDAMARFHTCVADAKTCAEGSGCLVGAGLDATGNLFRQFLQGVDKVLHH